MNIAIHITEPKTVTYCSQNPKTPSRDHNFIMGFFGKLLGTDKKKEEKKKQEEAKKKDEEKKQRFADPFAPKGDNEFQSNDLLVKMFLLLGPNEEA